MKVLELTSGIFFLRGGSNMGLIAREGKGLLIDAGLDKDAARRALRTAEEMGVRITALLLTHAHADHFGGARFLQRRLQNLPTYAPPLEAAMMEHPIMEPLFLFGGAAPIAELRQKFTLAKPCRVDHVVEPGPLELGPFRVEVVSLPGHAPDQIGVGVDEVLFCADALFPAATLEKHKVIFCADMDRALDTLDRLPDLPYAHFAPGHGPAYRSGDEIANICAANRARLQEVKGLVHTALEEPMGTASLVQHVADSLGLSLTTPTAYYLTRTTILAALSSLQGEEKIELLMRENKLLWERIA